MKVNTDLHVHSRFSAAVSRNMVLPEIAKEAAKKGVKIVGTGDCLFLQWLEEIQALPEEGGLFRLGETCFALTTEVEDAHRIHHLILVPEVSKALELRDGFADRSFTLDKDGRPRVRMEGAEIADLALEADCMIGPSHAFTPWTGMYAYCRTLTECYQEQASKIGYIELGLSADSDYADRIGELSSRTFLSNSDAHSPRCNKLAREFNQMEMEDLSFSELAMAITRQKGRHPTLNVGFFPEEGKYNRTACSRCFCQYSARQKDELLGRCPSCGGQIKLGVRDRIDLLADFPEPVHPPHRPPYLHLIPLAEIIAMALGYKSAEAISVKRLWNELVREKTEIEILVEANLSELKTDPRVIEAIEAFRSGKVVLSPGGGGKYGEVSLRPKLPAAEDVKCEEIKAKQRSLFDF
jgi:uncharacterized protein (TIGR00375 family)